MIPVDELLRDHQEFHSDLQMDAFITLRSGGTLYGCYKQALRELNSRRAAEITREAKRRLFDLEIEERRKPCVDPYQEDVNRIRIEEAEQSREFNAQALADTRRELARFQAQATAIREALESRGVSFPLDNDTRNELDREMWEHRLKCLAAVDLIHCGRLERSTIEFLQAIEPRSRRRLYSLIFDSNNHRKLIDWYLDHEPDMPRLESLECLKSNASRERSLNTSPMDAR